MKRKMTAAITVVSVTCLILTSSVFAYAATTKPTIKGFASMAASVEKSYGTVLELDLTMRNGEPVYKANVIVGGKRVAVYFNALTGTEIERRDAVALDDEETVIYTNYDIGSSASVAALQGQTVSEIAAQTQTSYSSIATITYERAKEIALAKVGGGTVKEIELDYEHGVLVYEVEIKYNDAEYDVDIDAATGEIVKYKSEYSTNNATTTQNPSTTPKPSQSDSTASTQITYDRAKEIALAKVGGGTVKEIELDYEKERLVYEVEIKYNGQEYEIDIDAATGEIVKYKIDD